MPQKNHFKWLITIFLSYPVMLCIFILSIIFNDLPSAILSAILFVCSGLTCLFIATRKTIKNDTRVFLCSLVKGLFFLPFFNLMGAGASMACVDGVAKCGDVFRLSGDLITSLIKDPDPSRFIALGFIVIFGAVIGLPCSYPFVRNAQGFGTKQEV